MRQALDPDNTGTLVIGFARRFATYKRALLLFQDRERLARLLNDPERPVIVLYAGKAHPDDKPGQELIRMLMQYVDDPAFRDRVFFIESYGIKLARRLVCGVDVWLNNPQYPLEACGTSGQKAAADGVVNLSVLDGWWAEGYNGDNGWAIGEGIEADDDAAQDEADVLDLYRTLEQEIIPLYYVERSADGLPGEWLRMVKESMRTLIPAYSMRRMVKQYSEELYLPAAGELQV
jgi:starch phosphorylase